MLARLALLVAAGLALAAAPASRALACDGDCHHATQTHAAAPADPKDAAKPVTTVAKGSGPTAAVKCDCEKGGKGCTCPKGQCDCPNCHGPKKGA